MGKAIEAFQNITYDAMSGVMVCIMVIVCVMSEFIHALKYDREHRK